MLIVCPSCASEYTIDPEKLGADGRTVRCALCRDTWFAAPDGAACPTRPGRGRRFRARREPVRRAPGRTLARSGSLGAVASSAAQVPAAWIERGRGVASQLLARHRPGLPRNVMSRSTDRPGTHAAGHGRDRECGQRRSLAPLEFSSAAGMNGCSPPGRAPRRGRHCGPGRRPASRCGSPGRRRGARSGCTSRPDGRGAA